jgi:hypothetical protein
LASHAHPDDVAHGWFPAFKGLQCRFADHAPVGHHGDFAPPEAAPQPLNDRYQGGDVGGVTRPQLTADGVALHVNGQAHHHLGQVGPVIFIVTAFAQALAALAFKVKGGSVEKD